MEVTAAGSASDEENAAVKYAWQRSGSSDFVDQKQKMDERREQLLQLMPEFMDEGLDIDCCHPLIEEWLELVKQRDHLLHMSIEQENEKLLEDHMQHLYCLLKQLQPYQQNSLTPEFQRNLRLIQKDVNRFFNSHQIVPSAEDQRTASSSAENMIYTEKEEMGLSDSMKMLVLVDKAEGTEALSGEQKETQTMVQEVLPPGEWKETQTDGKGDPETEFKETQTHSLETQHVSTQPDEAYTDMKGTQTATVNTLNTSSQAVEDTDNKGTQSEMQVSANGLQLNLLEKIDSEYKETQTPVVETQHVSVQPEEKFTLMKETQTKGVKTFNTSSQAVEEKHTSTKETQASHVESVVEVAETSMQTPSVDIQAMSSQTDQTSTELKETQTSVIATKQSFMQTEENHREDTAALPSEAEAGPVNGTQDTECEGAACNSDNLKEQQHRDVDVVEPANIDAEVQNVGQKNSKEPVGVTEGACKVDEARSETAEGKSRKKKPKSKRSRLK